jgi:hypothetical protein
MKKDYTFHKTIGLLQFVKVIHFLLIFDNSMDKFKNKK